MSPQLGPVYEFGAFRLEVGERRLLCDGRPIPLTARVFDTLRVLVEHAGRLLTKDELMQSIWPDSVVEENNLNHNVSVLRRALGEQATGQSYIETVPRAGYRFVAEVRESIDERRTPSHAGVSAHEIRICTTADKVRIAYATVGSGPPLVKTANWLNHLEFDWKSPVWRHLFGTLARDHQLVRYDERGTGLSDWEVDDISFDAFVSDLEAVVDAAGLERFALLGISQGCAVSVAYAVRHPERVAALVLHGGYLRGWKNRPETALRGEALQTLIRLDWGRDNPAIREMFTSSFVPDGSGEQIAWFNELQRVSTSPANAVRLRAAFGAIDVAELASRVSVPTLVLHSTGDRVIQFAAGRELAAAIPGARFVPIESRNHLILEQEPIWLQYVETIRGFLASDASSFQRESSRRPGRRQPKARS
ncbi:MAG TPA: alpha/beta fold hydrolase [Candidatus Eisenbacteria bacterium]|jgi:DNA-binding winged helix-turn-helix (wHTH) protein/alpha-beta hydrolase superfamily lysophospholipase